MKVGIIGGGSWGTTLAQVLHDNQHQSLIFDINQKNIDKINNHIHPLFDIPIPEALKGTNDLLDVVNFSDYILLALPTAAIRGLLKEINQKLTRKTYFINVSKGIEPQTFSRVSEIVKEEINPKFLGGFVALTGPSHAEETIKRKLTLLTAASNDEKLAIKVQKLFSNSLYMRVYRTDDLVGAEVGGAAKNAIAIVSGFATGLKMGENARAALITRGVVEIVKCVEAMGGDRETAFGLTGVGDLIVTASSENSRNFQAGKRIGEGVPLDQVLGEATMTIEGVRSIIAFHELACEKKLDLPIISTAYNVLFNNLDIKEAITQLLTRKLKNEKSF
ncbi:MAG: NAD(P)H-dependent glycerol-3-phosphate dehydrogenase [Acholeplasmataceae bacterium]|jgi:glycerol-3-phosphate dehydrogenase (NAD(P)+)